MGGADVFVGHHFADGVDVGAVGHEQGREGMAKAMKGHLLGDTGIFEPLLERLTGMGPAESFEDESAGAVTAVRDRFLADG